MLSFDFILESARAGILLFLVGCLWHIGEKRHFIAASGWKYIQTGFLLLLFGSLLDITDNFQSLNSYVVIGDTETEAFLEKIVGYLGGFILLTIGLMRWGPSVERLMIEINGREIAEQAALNSEQQFRDYTEVSSDWFWEQDKEFRYTNISVNQNGNFVGLDLDYLGRTRWEFAEANPDEDNHWRQHVEDHLAHRNYRDFRYSTCDRDGNLRVVSASGKPVFDADGNFEGYRGTARDVTDLVKAQTVNDQFISALNNLDEGLALWDIDGRLIMLNENNRKLAGPARDELVPGIIYEEWLRIILKHDIAPEAKGREDAWLREKLNFFRTPIGEQEVLRGNRWHLFRVLKLPDGSTLHSTYDIHDLKMKEMSLRKSEQEFRDFSELSSDWLWEQDENFKFSRIVAFKANNFIDITGSYIGSTRWGYAGVDPNEDEHWRQHVEDCRAHRTFRDFQYRTTDNDGKEIFLSANGKPYYNDDGAFKGYRGTVIDISRIKQSEKKAQEDTARLQRIMDTSPIVFNLVNSDGIYTFVNERSAGGVGLSKEELLGRQAKDFYANPDDRNKIVSELSQHGFASNIEILLKRADGSTFWALVSIIPDPDDECIFIAWYYNIDERLREHRRLQDFSASIDAMSDPIAIFDTEDRFIFTNEAFRENAKVHGNTDVLGHTLEEHLHVVAYTGSVLEAVGREDEWISERMAIHNSASGVFEIKQKDGFYFQGKENILPAGGRVLQLTDISQLKKAEEELIRHRDQLEKTVRERTRELQNSEKDYRTILDNIQDTFYRADLEGHIVMVSPSVESMLGYLPDELIGQKLGDFYINPGDRQAFLDELTASGGQVSAYESPLRHKDGHEVWVSTNAHFYHDEDGNVLGVEGTTRNITERKVMQQRSERLTTAINQLNESVVLFDDKDRVVIANDAWRELNRPILEYTHPGITFEEHLRAGIAKHLFPNAEGREEEWLQERMTRHSNPSGPVQYPRQDGKWIQIHEQRLPDGGTILVIGDITELKQSEAQLREVLDNSPIGVTIATFPLRDEKAASERLYANQAFADLFGARSPADFHNIPISESWVDQSQIHEVNAILWGGDQLLNFEARRNRIDGTKFWVLMNSRAIIFDGRQCIMHWMVDITDRKHAEDALRASESQLESILRIAPEAVIVIGSDQKIQHFNQGAERLFGYKADEIIDRPLDVLLPQNIRKAHKKHVEEFEASPDDFRIMDARSEVTALRKDGSVFPAKASLSKLDLDGENIFVTLLHDITESKRAEEKILASKQEAEIANRAKSEFLANMSHELRTPLNAIIGFSEMTRSEIWGKVGDEHYLEYADMVHASGIHLLELINDILDISKIEAGETVIEDADVDISKNIKDCFLMVAERAKNADIEIQYTNSAEQINIRADQRHFKQVLLNLLSNAVKFTPAGGQISVSCRLDEVGGYEIAVTDTGIGIAPENIAKILQPFGQVANSEVRNHDGTGLGLPICKTLMELHGGSLKIQSELNKGTKAILAFPPERTIKS